MVIKNGLKQAARSYSLESKSTPAAIKQDQHEHESCLEKEPSYRAIDEAWVEAPHLLLELSGLEDSHKGLAGGLNIGIAGLAALRAGQCLSQPSLEAKLEGVSAAALALSSMATLFPGAVAANVGTAAHGAHGLLEAGLGVHETIEAVSEKEGWRHVASGLLGVAHGSVATLSTFFPALETAGNIVGLAALVGRVSLGVKH